MVARPQLGWMLGWAVVTIGCHNATPKPPSVERARAATVQAATAQTVSMLPVHPAALSEAGIDPTADGPEVIVAPLPTAPSMSVEGPGEGPVDIVPGEVLSPDGEPWDVALGGEFHPTTRAPRDLQNCVPPIPPIRLSPSVELPGDVGQPSTPKVDSMFPELPPPATTGPGEGITTPPLETNRPPLAADEPRPDFVPHATKSPTPPPTGMKEDPAANPPIDRELPGFDSGTKPDAGVTLPPLPRDRGAAGVLVPGDNVYVIMKAVDAPNSPYALQAGDEIRIEYLHLRAGEGGIQGIPPEYLPSLDRTVLVQPDGTLSLPYLNTVTAAGMTTHQLAVSLNEQYRPFYWEPQMLVTLVRGNPRGADLAARIPSTPILCQVDTMGMIEVPGVGRVPAAGHTPAQLKLEIQRILQKVAPHVTVEVRLPQDRP